VESQRSTGPHCAQLPADGLRAWGGVGWGVAEPMREVPALVEPVAFRHLLETRGFIARVDEAEARGKVPAGPENGGKEA
jgi:hypothetical protein